MARGKNETQTYDGRERSAQCTMQHTTERCSFARKQLEDDVVL